MTKPKVPTLKQIAARIQEHLKRVRSPHAECVPAGNALRVAYGAAMFRHSLTKTEALQYLAYLDGGGTGTHLLGKAAEHGD